MWQFTTKVPLLTSTFDNIKNFASKRKINKLSNYTRFKRLNCYLWRYEQKDGVYFLLLSLFFTIYFAQYLKTSLADIRYLLLWCVTNDNENEKSMFLRTRRHYFKDNDSNGYTTLFTLWRSKEHLNFFENHFKSLIKH